MIEGFDSFNKVPQYLMNKLYDDNRTWRMVETCHNVWFKPYDDKMFHPDGYIFCTPWHIDNTFQYMKSPMVLSEYPLEDLRITKEEKLEAKKKTWSFTR